MLLAALCLGVPVWLAIMGGTPFARVDPLLPLRAVTGGRGRVVDLPDVAAWLGQVALVIAWSAWAWAVTCILLEARYWWSGRAPTDLPGSRTMQWVVAGLVGTAFAFGGAARSPHDLHPVGSRAARTHVGATVTRISRDVGIRARAPAGVGAGEEPTASTDAPAGTVASDPVEEPRAVPVPRVDAVDRPVGPHTSAPAARPGIATGGPGHPDAVGSGVDPESRSTLHTVRARETLWSVAEERLGTARRWRELAERNYGRVQPDGGRLTGDHWIRPGWELVLPVVTDGADGSTDVAPPGVPATTTSGTAVTGRQEGDGTAPRSAHPVQGSGREPDLPVVPVVPVGAGVVGVGVSELVDRLRRVQQRNREPGTRIRLPDPLLREFEQRVRVGDGAGVLWAAECAVRSYLSAGESAAFPPGVLGVRVSDETVELVLDGPVVATTLPSWFRREADPTTVVVDRSALHRWRPVRPQRSSRPGGAGGPEGPDGGTPRSVSDGGTGNVAGFPLPTLVTIGRSDDCVVFLHLEGLGSLVLDGDRSDTEGVVRALALELATSRWSSCFDLVLVGFGVDLERLDRVSVTGATGPLAADLAWRRLRDSVRLEDRGFASVVEARFGDASDAWDPVVVVCGPGLPVADVQALVGIGAERGGGVAVVAASDASVDHGPARRIAVGRPGDLSALGSLGAVLEPQRVTEDEVGQVVQLLDVASVDPGADQDQDQDLDLHPGLDADPGSGPDADPDPDAGPGSGTSGNVPALVGRNPAASVRVGATPTMVDGGDGSSPGRRRRSGDLEVEVAVLGPVEIRGAARAFTRAWAKDLVVYLAVHPEGAANETWATALWPERVMAPSSLHSTVSVARRALGTASDGSDHLPRAHGRLRLGPSVGTDWDRFRELAGSDDVEDWSRALDLVRGRPLEGMRSTDWSVLDGTAPAIESAVVDLSGRLAGARLRAGDPRGAEWSARKGLVVSPYDERLYRMLLRAADAAGNPGGVESVMAELVRVVADDIEPIESVHPSTLALYRSLSRRRVTVL